MPEGLSFQIRIKLPVEFHQIIGDHLDDLMTAHELILLLQEVDDGITEAPLRERGISVP
jgi:hypothetical protein